MLLWNLEKIFLDSDDVKYDKHIKSYIFNKNVDTVYEEVKEVLNMLYDIDECAV